MRILTAIAAFTLSSATMAQSGPPAGFFGDTPNTGGTLYLTFCTPAGWPCHDFRQEVWGQICHQSFADGFAENQTHGIFTHYSGWKCPGFVASPIMAKCMGYGDGGPANKKIPTIEPYLDGDVTKWNPEFVECMQGIYGRDPTAPRS